MGTRFYKLNMYIYVFIYVGNKYQTVIHTAYLYHFIFSKLNFFWQFSFLFYLNTCLYITNAHQFIVFNFGYFLCCTRLQLEPNYNRNRSGIM